MAMRSGTVNTHAFNGKVDQIQVDITEPETPVGVEIDHDRKVLYVHMEGYSVLRICRIPSISVEQHRRKSAVIVWSADDVKSLRPDWSIKACQDWLDYHNHKVVDANMDHGWQVLETLLTDSESEEH